MAIQLDGHLVATTMRTPGHDYELAAGYCLTEGLLAGASGRGRAVLRHRLGPRDRLQRRDGRDRRSGARSPTPRLTPTTSSCGLCGAAELDALLERLAPLPADLPRSCPRSGWPRWPSRLWRASRCSPPPARSTARSRSTSDGAVVVAREDVGRHNAVDKVIGRLLLDDRLPAHDLALAVTSRASFEIVQKAWSAGFAAVVAVSAPTALAVTAARRAGMTLAGFARAGPAERLRARAPPDLRRRPNGTATRDVQA